MSDFLGKEVLAPAKTVIAGTVEINVKDRSKVITIAPAAGSTLTEDDSCEIFLIIEDDAARTVASGEKLGANRPRFEIMSRGKYLLNRISITTEDVGGYEADGMQAAA